MSEDIIAKLVLTLQQYPVLTLFFVFLVAFSESLIIIGLIVPGAILMIIIGALIAMGALDFWYSVLFAIVGAISGDSLSYWLGSRYQQRLQTIWPLSRHPELMDRANIFFHTHGVKSIILSRFIGLLRPVIPAVAGMSKMPWVTFLSANIISAIAWAPLYLLPGLVFGLSLEVASEFAGKFIFLVLLLLTAIIAALWLVQRLYVFSKPYNDKLVSWLLTWGEKHRIAGEVPAAIFDKTHPELRGLTFTAVIIFLITSGLNLLFDTVIIPYNLFPYDISSFNQLVYYNLQALRSPPFDTIMLWFSFTGSSYFVAFLYLVLGSFLVFKKDLFTLWHWLAAILLPLLLIPVLENDLTLALQQKLNIGIQSLSFVAVLSAIGFLTVIINTGLSFTRQKIIYYLSAAFVFFIALSQLYFAQQVFSQVITGLIIGLLWFNLVAIAYRHHANKTTSHKTRKEILAFIFLLLAYPGIKVIQNNDIQVLDKEYFVMATDSWIESGWELLPIQRKGINQKKNNIFNLQWLGTENEISNQLEQNGFSTSKNTLKLFSNWFLNSSQLNELPLLPYIHKGEYETLRYYYHDKLNQELLVIRLWQSKYKLRQEHPMRPLWFGTLNTMKVKNNLGINYLVTKDKPVQHIKPLIKNMVIEKKQIENNRTVFLIK